MKIYKTKNFPFGKFIAITIWPIGLFTKVELTEVDINHEKIHWQQQKELLGIFFYLIYFLRWLYELIKIPFGGDKKAYHDISFEVEAHGNDENLDYLKTRKKYAQWRKNNN